MASLEDIEREVIGLTNAVRKLRRQSPEEKVHSLEQQVAELFGIVAVLRGEVAALNGTIAALVEEKQSQRGPKVESGRNSTRWDAWRVKFGDLKNADTKTASECLGLSTGQIYAIKYEQSHKSVTLESFSEDGEEQFGC